MGDLVSCGGREQAEPLLSCGRTGGLQTDPRIVDGNDVTMADLGRSTRNRD